jgi:hypothetical protein
VPPIEPDRAAPVHSDLPFCAMPLGSFVQFAGGELGLMEPRVIWIPTRRRRLLRRVERFFVLG